MVKTIKIPWNAKVLRYVVYIYGKPIGVIEQFCPRGYCVVNDDYEEREEREEIRRKHRRKKNKMPVREVLSTGTDDLKDPAEPESEMPDYGISLPDLFKGMG
jgi:hypothetical protein